MADSGGDLRNYPASPYPSRLDSAHRRKDAPDETEQRHKSGRDDDETRDDGAAVTKDFSSPTQAPTEEDEEEDVEEEDEEEGEEEGRKRASTATAAAALPVARLRRARMHRRNREAPRNEQGQLYCDHEDCTSSKPIFSRRCEWDKHMDKHERPYRCEEKGCEKLRGFTYSGGLLRHEREVHGKHGGLKRPLMCPYDFCKRSTGLGFTRQENLNEHLRRVHRVVRRASTSADGGHAGGGNGSAAGDEQLHWTAVNDRSSRATTSTATVTRAGSSGSSGATAARAAASKKAAVRRASSTLIPVDSGRRLSLAIARETSGGGPGAAGAGAAHGTGAGQKRKFLQMAAEVSSAASSIASASASARGGHHEGEGDESDGSFRVRQQQRLPPLQQHQQKQYQQQQLRPPRLLSSSRRADDEAGLGSVGGSGGGLGLNIAELRDELTRLRKRVEYLEGKVGLQDKTLSGLLRERPHFALKAGQKEAVEAEEEQQQQQHEQELEHELEQDDDDADGRQRPRSADQYDEEDDEDDYYGAEEGGAY